MSKIDRVLRSNLKLRHLQLLVALDQFRHLGRALEQLKARSAQTTVLVEEGDLTRLLPKLRMGELDLFVGRLEPGYASPDLETEALYDEPMVAVVRPGHALLAQPASWQALAD